MRPQYTIEQAATYLEFEFDTVYRYVLRGKLQATERSKIGLIDIEELERFKRERRKPGGQKGRQVSEETRQKVRAARLAYHPLRDSPRAAEYRAKISATKLAQKVRGAQAGHWKGGRRVDEAGYIYIYTPTHPYANATGYVFEHRLVMEQVLGRYLTPEDVVHHINEVRDDNRPENLQVMTHVEHMRLHGRLRNPDRE